LVSNITVANLIFFKKRPILMTGKNQYAIYIIIKTTGYWVKFSTDKYMYAYKFIEKS